MTPNSALICFATGAMHCTKRTIFSLKQLWRRTFVAFDHDLVNDSLSYGIF